MTKTGRRGRRKAPASRTHSKRFANLFTLACDVAKRLECARLAGAFARHATDETLRCMSIGAHAAWRLFFQVVPIGAEFGVTLFKPLGGSQLQQLFEIAHE